MTLGDILKERGQALALDHAGTSWKERALLLLTEFCKKGPGKEGSFALEDFKIWATEERGLDHPASHNAWGSIPRIAIKEQIIKPLNRFRTATLPSAHSRYVRLYVAKRSQITQ